MSNSRTGNSVTLEQWINAPSIRRGILSVYAGEPFDYEQNSAGYEIGRQIAILAKSEGLRTRGSILRKKPNSEQMAIVKTKLSLLSSIVYRKLQFTPEQMRVEMF